MSEMSELGISFDGRDPADLVLAKAEAAVRHGTGSIWLACHLFQRDPVATAGVLLSRYPGADVVLVALSPYVLHPVYIAMAAATLNEFFPGRVSLCLGVGAPVDLADAGIDAPSPLGPMREAVDICRSLFSGEKVRIDGKWFQVRDQHLASGRQDLPILLAASGPKMLRLAGRAADGVVLSAGASVEFLRWCLEQVTADGVPENFRSHAFIYAAVADEAAAAYDRVRRPLAVTLRGRHHTRNIEMAGNHLDQDAIVRALASGDAELAESYIGNPIVESHAAAGTPGMFVARIADYRAAGIDNIVLASIRTPAQIDTVLSAANG